MQFDLDAMSAEGRYELLLGTVVPRPIAIVTTIADDGSINAAPYSLFNVMGIDPPIVALCVLPHPDGRLKDTANNILETQEFVINLVSEGIAEAMNVTCVDAPAGTSEIELAGIETVQSLSVRPPRIKGSPIAFECRFHTSLSFGPHQSIIIGRVVSAYVADEFVVDAPIGLVDTARLKLIGSMHGAKWYARTSDLFEMIRPTWAQWIGREKER